MQQYAIISDRAKMSILNNQGEGMPFTTVLRTNPQESGENGFKDNIQSIIGKPKFKQLVKYSADLPKVKITGYVTQTVLSGSMTASRVSKEQNYCFLNERPIDMPRKMKNLFNEIYRQFNASMTPMLILRLQVEDENYDINASPDKREVFIKNERELLDALRVHLSDFFENIQRIKAYEAPGEGRSKAQNMDLLDSFKKIESMEPSGAITSENEAWTSKKRNIDEISKSNSPKKDSPTGKSTNEKTAGKTSVK
jgi:DNA mismatch repair ATPase MutL